MSDTQRPDGRLARWRVLFGSALVVAALLNGSVFFLKRTGILETEAYRGYWTGSCATMSRGAGLLAAPCCVSTAYPDPRIHPLFHGRGIMDRLYAYEAYEVLPKAVKDALVIGLLIGSGLLVVQKLSPVPDPRATWPISLALAAGALAFAATVAQHGVWLAAAGARGFIFLPIALMAGWLMRQPGTVAKAVALLLVLEGILVSYEMAYGMPLRSCPFPMRAVGTLDKPNSLGAFAAAGLAFGAGFLESRGWLIGLASVALFLILAGGSGTGLVCLAVLAAFLGIRAASPPRRVLIAALGLGVAAVVLLVLPGLTGRGDIFMSAVRSPARTRALSDALRERGRVELLFGRGLGFATNAAKNLSDYHIRDDHVPADRPGPRIADSTLSLLMEQTGLVGLAFYVLILAWAFRKDRRLRGFYAVVAVSSLTLNIPELFPVNLLLGLALAHTVSLSTARAATSEA